MKGNTMAKQMNGILLGWGTLITAITALVLCVVAFTTVKVMATDNRKRIDRLEIHYAETTKIIHKIDKTQAVMAAHMGIHTAPEGD